MRYSTAMGVPWSMIDKIQVFCGVDRKSTKSEKSEKVGIKKYDHKWIKVWATRIWTVARARKKIVWNNLAKVNK